MVSITHSGVIVTPGTPTGYNFFPPPGKEIAGGSGGGSGGMSGNGEGNGRGEAFQRCVRFVEKGDMNFRALPSSFYSVPSIRVYYQMHGGDGGPTANGGGGGSSAILVNGVVVAVAAGADGNQKSVLNKGEFWVNPNDTIRVISGGGGGSGAWGHSGGGGGAGWRGGGGGGAYTPGKGGTTTPGAGGSGSMPGTAGVGNNGGVSTYPDGGTSQFPAAMPSFPFAFNVTERWIVTDHYRWPATPTRSGSASRSYSGNSPQSGYYESGGFGGAFGWGGSHTARTTYELWFGSIWGHNSSNEELRMTSGLNMANIMYDHSYTSNVQMRARSDNNFQIDRKPLTWEKQESGHYQTYIENGGVPGQVALMFNAPDCSLLNNSF